VPRKVVFVNRFFFPDLSATSQMLADLAARLAYEGIEVHVICSRQLYEDAAAQLPARELSLGVEVHRVWTARFGRASLRGRALDYASFYLTATLRLWTLLRAGDVAVIKTDPPLLSVFAAGVVALRRAQLVNWLQDVFPEVASRLGVARLPRLVERFLRMLRDRSLAGARMNVAIGARMGAHLLSSHISRAQLRIIENWADGTAICPKPAAQSELRARLGLTLQHLVIGYSGNLGRAHEFDTLLGAAEALRDDPAFVFLMIGGGVRMAELKQRVAASGLASFRFVSYQPRAALGDSMAAADVHLACLLPPLEGLIVPSKVYGILAAGRPAIFIGAADGEVAQLIREAECGLTVAPGEGPRLAAELRRLKDDTERLTEWGRRARAMFEARFTLDSAARKWTLLLAQLGVSAATDARRSVSDAAALDQSSSVSNQLGM
jgi:colanic acid biosynthesis glycosyl transferase WcaI